MIVHFSAEAERDIEEIGDHIALDDPARAVIYVRELRERCLALAEMPRRFPLVERYEAAGVRRCLHGSHLIFYRIDGDTVAVLHVLHGARDYAAIISL